LDQRTGETNQQLSFDLVALPKRAAISDAPFSSFDLIQGSSASFSTSASAANLWDGASTMGTEYLDQLARQLKANKSPACRRAINRILEDVKKRCESGEIATPMDAEAVFRKSVEDDRACQKAKAESV
jgi:hypothetical protein